MTDETTAPAPTTEDVTGSYCRRTYSLMLQAVGTFLASQLPRQPDDEAEAARQLSTVFFDAAFGHELICRTRCGSPLTPATAEALGAQLVHTVASLAGNPYLPMVLRYGLHPDQPGPDYDQAHPPPAEVFALLVALTGETPDENGHVPAD